MVLWILHFDISMDWFKGKSTGNHRFSQTHIFQRGRYTTNKLHTQTLWEFLLEPGRVVPWSEPCLQRHLIPGNHRISPSYGHRLKICGSSWKPDGGLERGFYFSVYWECHHPNWRTPSFFRGVGIPPTRKLRIFPPQLKPGPGFSPAQQLAALGSHQQRPSRSCRGGFFHPAEFNRSNQLGDPSHRKVWTLEMRTRYY